MSRNHGKNTVIIIDGTALTRNIKNSTAEDSLDLEDVTCYGTNRKEYDVSLGDGKITMDGNYATGTTGPKAILQGIRRDQESGAKTTVTLIRRPEGTGSGKPQESYDVWVGKYVETSPAAGYVTFSCELQPTGDPVYSTQA